MCDEIRMHACTHAHTYGMPIQMMHECSGKHKHIFYTICPQLKLILTDKMNPVFALFKCFCLEVFLRNTEMCFLFALIAI